jgi:hypothetical protein
MLKHIDKQDSIYKRIANRRAGYITTFFDKNGNDLRIPFNAIDFFYVVKTRVDITERDLYLRGSKDEVVFEKGDIICVELYEINDMGYDSCIGVGYANYGEHNERYLDFIESFKKFHEFEKEKSDPLIKNLKSCSMIEGSEELIFYGDEKRINEFERNKNA